MENKDSIQKRPAPVLYFLASNFFATYNLLKLNLHVTGEKPQGPALILSNHTSNQDYKIIVSACMPNRVNFLGSYHWFTFKKFNYWLRRIGVIPKHQFAQDISSMKKIRYVLKNNGLVYIAPEGTIYSNGKLGYMSPSIAKMIKSFKVPVYTSKIEGAGMGNAKWALNRLKGYINVDTHKLLDVEQATNLSVDEIMEKIKNALSYDDFEFQKKYNVTVEQDGRADGFDTMFYKCPSCGKEFTITSNCNDIECTACHAKAFLNKHYKFEWQGDKQYFENYIQWYDWQYECLKKEMEAPDFELKEEVDYGIDQAGCDNYKKVGKGVMTFSKEGWTYTGTYEGNNITEHDDARDVFLATLKIGKHFELPFKDGHCRVFYPVKDGRTSMKWHLASRAMAEKLGQ